MESTRSVKMDTFKCGQCELEVHDLGQFLEHKQICFPMEFPSEIEDFAAEDSEIKDDTIIEVIETPLDVPVIDKLTCSICLKKFKRPYNLKIHKETIHSEGQKFQCQICEKSFNQKSNLTKHLSTHKMRPESKLEPDEITFEVVTRGGRKIAIEPMHSENTTKKPFVCEDCNASFSTLQYLKKHKLRCETVDKPYKCSICDKAFTLQEYLKKHFLTHDEAMHQCQVCDKLFKRSDILKRHMKIHGNSPKFKCPFSDLTDCTKEFYRQDKLKEHMKSHGNVKQVKCELCKDLFLDEKALEEHAKVHENEENGDNNIVLYVISNE